MQCLMQIQLCRLNTTEDISGTHDAIKNIQKRGCDFPKRRDFLKSISQTHPT